jgi:hypothetical protein
MRRWLALVDAPWCARLDSAAMLQKDAFCPASFELRRRESATLLVIGAISHDDEW